LDQDVRGSVLQALTYVYDPTGRKTVAFDYAGSVTTIGYDPLSRVIADESSGPEAHAYTYAYDPNGNRVASSESRALIQYSYDAADRLTSSTDGATYVVDAKGDLTCVQGLGIPVTMSYDGEGRVVVRSEGTAKTTFIYSGDGLLRAQYGVSCSTLIWDGTRLLGEVQ
jgi:YD repeat-containing protein